MGLADEGGLLNQAFKQEHLDDDDDEGMMTMVMMVMMITIMTIITRG